MGENMECNVLNLDLELMKNPLDKESVAHVIGLTHAYIMTRLLRESSKPIESDTTFLKVAIESKDFFLRGKKVDFDALEKQVHEYLHKFENLEAGILQGANILAFAQENEIVWSSFNEKDWATYESNCENCIALTSKHFLEPVVCIQYCVIRLKSPLEDVTKPAQLKRAQTLSTFGWCCTIVGHNEGITYARTKLRDIGFEHFADKW